MLTWIVRSLFSHKDSSTVMHINIRTLWFSCSGTLVHFRPWLSSLHSSFWSYLAFWSSKPSFSGFAHLWCQKQLFFPTLPLNALKSAHASTRAPLFVWQLTCNLYSRNGTTSSYAAFSIGIYTTVKIYCNNGISKWSGKQDMVPRL